MVSFNVALYYNTIIAWCLYYLFQVRNLVSIRLRNDLLLIWRVRTCRAFNTHCPGPSVPRITLKTDPTSSIWSAKYVGMGLQLRYTAQRNNLFDDQMSSPTQYFWYRETLDISPDINTPQSFNWKITACLLLAWLMAYLCMAKGSF